MTVFVTRPAPDNEKTAQALRARGYEVLLSPTMRFEAIAFRDDDDAEYDAVILTSANAIRAIENHAARQRLIELPAFAVGDHTADVARSAGFRKVSSAKGNAGSLRDLVAGAVAAKTLKKGGTLCYLAGADLARDLSGELGVHGFTVVTQTAYRMVPIGSFSPAVSDAFRSDRIRAVVHYSRRSARAFLDAARAAGVEISALSLPQCCISDAVAAVLRDAGAMQVAAARTPDEAALFDVLDRIMKPASH